MAGAPFASTLLRQAVVLEPGFVLAQVGLAVAEAVAGGCFVPAPDRSPLHRGERQHREIVETASGATSPAPPICAACTSWGSPGIC